MPAILTTPTEFDRLLEADTVDALALQRPLPDDALRIVAKGEKEDRSPEFCFVIRIALSLPRNQGFPAAWQCGLSPLNATPEVEYLLWLTETEANRLASLRRRGESYSQAVIRPAMAQD